MNKARRKGVGEGKPFLRNLIHAGRMCLRGNTSLWLVRDAADADAEYCRVRRRFLQ